MGEVAHHVSLGQTVHPKRVPDLLSRDCRESPFNGISRTGLNRAPRAKYISPLFTAHACKVAFWDLSSTYSVLIVSTARLCYIIMSFRLTIS